MPDLIYQIVQQVYTPASLAVFLTIKDRADWQRFHFAKEGLISYVNSIVLFACLKVFSEKLMTETIPYVNRTLKSITPFISNAENAVNNFSFFGFTFEKILYAAAGGIASIALSQILFEKLNIDKNKKIRVAAFAVTGIMALYYGASSIGLTLFQLPEVFKFLNSPNYLADAATAGAFAGLLVSALTSKR